MSHYVFPRVNNYCFNPIVDDHLWKTKAVMCTLAIRSVHNVPPNQMFQKELRFAPIFNLITTNTY